MMNDHHRYSDSSVRPAFVSSKILETQNRGIRLRPPKPPGGKCPQAISRDACPLVCKYNHFESEELTIDAWELRCLDCGWRETIAYRSDEDESPDVGDDPEQCPFCKLKELRIGRNPCEDCRGDANQGKM